jgi:hypothetical protein
MATAQRGNSGRGTPTTRYKSRSLWLQALRRSQPIQSVKKRLLTPFSLPEFLSIPILEQSKREILWDNCARLYGED